MSKYSQANNKASQRYNAEHLEQVTIRVAKGGREKIKEAASEAGMSMAGFVVAAINEKAGKVVATTSATECATLQPD